jgi:UDP-N-acetylglucosamine 2-epimerase
MSQQFFEELDLPEPDCYLDIGSGTHPEQIGKGLIAIEKKLRKERPDMIVVSGDTNSSLLAAIASVKMNIPVAHMEAGPRTFNRKMPEEINRIMIDHISTLLFAPTKTSVRNLKKEGITKGVQFTGDIMLDSFLKYNHIVNTKHARERYDLEPKGYYLLTIHREENTDNKSNLTQIVDAVSSLNEKVLFPIHPRTQKRLNEFGLMNKLTEAKNIMACPPLGYFTFLSALSQAKVVLTDSGGVQKQAFFYEVPCITLWSCQIGWVETLGNGWNRIVNPEKESIIDSLSYIRTHWPGKRPEIKTFGNGDASQRMVSIISDYRKELDD